MRGFVHYIRVLNYQGGNIIEARIFPIDLYWIHHGKKYIRQLDQPRLYHKIRPLCWWPRKVNRNRRNRLNCSSSSNCNLFTKMVRKIPLLDLIMLSPRERRWPNRTTTYVVSTMMYTHEKKIRFNKFHSGEMFLFFHAFFYHLRFHFIKLKLH